MRFSRFALAIACSSVIVPSCWSQTPDTGRTTNQITTPNVNGIFVSSVPNTPFSATVEIVSRQTLGDDTINTLRMINNMARDSKGRTLVERRHFVAEAYQGESPLQTSIIYDPVAGAEYRLDPYLLVAWRSARTGPDTPTPGTVPIADPAAAPQTKIEDLGTQSFEGMTIHGTRQTASDGVVDEYWYAPDLSICVLRKHKDSRWKLTFTTTKLDRHEPDASVFMVPATYKTVAQSAREISGQPGVYAVGGGVTPPSVIHSANPQYSMAARQAKVKGICVVALIVDSNGMPQHVHVVRGLGSGLDENAVKAVEQYRFKPAQYQGKAVPVEVNIEVNFDIY